MLALACLALVLAPSAAAGARPAPRVDARAWILIDARTGDTLAGRAAGRALPIASATKLMTAHVAFSELRLAKVVRAAPYAAIPGESLLGLRAGEPVSVRDLLYGLILRSGNDAALSLAVAAAGSEARFVRQMNLRAAALGLADTHYANPIGLDEPGNHSSALDLATLSRRLLARRAFARIAASRRALLSSLDPDRRIATRNTLLYRAPWTTGVKTGHTLGAGYVLVGSGARRGVELISAILGSPSEAQRDLDSLELLEYGFSLYRRRAAVRGGRELAAPTIRYSDGRLPLLAARGVTVGLRRSQRLRIEVAAPAEVEGPIRRNRRLGSAVVYVDGRRVAEVPLLAARSIPRATTLDRLRDFVSGWALLAVAAFVILIAAVFLRRWRGREREGEEVMRESREERRVMRKQRRRERVGSGGR